MERIVRARSTMRRRVLMVSCLDLSLDVDAGKGTLLGRDERRARRSCVQEHLAVRLALEERLGSALAKELGALFL